MQVSRDQLTALWKHADPGLCDSLALSSKIALDLAAIDSNLRLAHFLAQISHESNGGTILHENLVYTTTARLMAVWPTRFRNAAQAAPFVRNPQKLANEVYGDRLGNRRGTDDGWNYRGRGLIQVTGRENYARYGAATGLDLLNYPHLAADPHHMLTIAAAFWHDRPCNAAADRDDIEAVTRLINGGLNGLEDRKSWLSRWKQALG